MELGNNSNAIFMLDATAEPVSTQNVCFSGGQRERNKQIRTGEPNGWRVS